MKKVFVMSFVALFVAATMVMAQAKAKTYQVTGTVTELTDAKVVVQTIKGDEKWEIARDTETKVTGELKVGAKVTIEYRMTATTATVKAGEEKKEEKKAEKKEEKKAEEKKAE